MSTYNWTCQTSQIRPAPTPWCAHWLSEVQYMTAELNAYFGPITIQVISEQWHTGLWPFPTAMATDHEDVWLRQSLLHTRNRSLIYALAAMTQPAIQQWPELCQLGARSLGQWFLHQQPLLWRSAFEFARLHAEAIVPCLPLQTINPDQSLWARRSRFSYRHITMVELTEVLLPDLVAFPFEGVN